MDFNRTSFVQRLHLLFLKRLIKSDSLQSELVQVERDCDVIIGTFGRNLYSRNGIALLFCSINERKMYRKGDIVFMEWIERLNCAIKYIKKHLVEKIDYAEITDIQDLKCVLEVNV